MALNRIWGREVVSATGRYRRRSSTRCARQGRQRVRRDGGSARPPAGYLALHSCRTRAVCVRCCDAGFTRLVHLAENARDVCCPTCPQRIPPISEMYWQFWLSVH